MDRVRPGKGTASGPKGLGGAPALSSSFSRLERNHDVEHKWPLRHQARKRKPPMQGCEFAGYPSFILIVSHRVKVIVA